MKTTLIFFGLLFYGFGLFAPSKVVGQELNSFFSVDQKHVLGINGSLSQRFFFDRPTGLPLELVYRKFNSKNQAIRLRLEGSYSRIVEDDGILFEKKWNSSLGAAVGYEWHKPISQRWSWYYGGEIGLAYHWLDEDFAREIVLQNIPAVRYYYLDRRVLEPYGSGFFGLTFNLHSNYFLIIEQNFTFSKQFVQFITSGNLLPVDSNVDPPWDTISSRQNVQSITYTRLFISSKLGVHFKF